jgi:excisionase family DNA binding protein
MEEQEEYTVQEVAKRLRLNRYTVIQRINARQLRARKEGKEYRIRKDWLEEYIRSTEIKRGE